MARTPLRALLALALLALAAASADVSLDAVARQGGVVAPDAASPVVAKNRMRKPEITTPALVGLLVFFLFLAIFIPGFLCLWNIQPPQTFEVVEGSDARKKMQ